MYHIQNTALPYREKHLPSPQCPTPHLHQHCITESDHPLPCFPQCNCVLKFTSAPALQCEKPPPLAAAFSNLHLLQCENNRRLLPPNVTMISNSHQHYSAKSNHPCFPPCTTSAPALHCGKRPSLACLTVTATSNLSLPHIWMSITVRKTTTPASLYHICTSITL